MLIFAGLCQLAEQVGYYNCGHNWIISQEGRISSGHNLWTGLTVFML